MIIRFLDLSCQVLVFRLFCFSHKSLLWTFFRIWISISISNGWLLIKNTHNTRIKCIDEHGLWNVLYVHFCIPSVLINPRIEKVISSKKYRNQISNSHYDCDSQNTNIPGLSLPLFLWVSLCLSFFLSKFLFLFSLFWVPFFEIFCIDIYIPNIFKLFTYKKANLKLLIYTGSMFVIRCWTFKIQCLKWICDLKFLLF